MSLQEGLVAGHVAVVKVKAPALAANATGAEIKDAEVSTYTYNHEKWIIRRMLWSKGSDVNRKLLAFIAFIPRPCLPSPSLIFLFVHISFARNVFSIYCMTNIGSRVTLLAVVPPLVELASLFPSRTPLYPLLDSLLFLSIISCILFYYGKLRFVSVSLKIFLPPFHFDPQVNPFSFASFAPFPLQFFF